MNIADDNFRLMFCTLHLPKTQSYMIRRSLECTIRRYFFLKVNYHEVAPPPKKKLFGSIVFFYFYILFSIMHGMVKK